MILTILNNWQFIVGLIGLTAALLIYYVIRYCLKGDSPHSENTSVLDQLIDVTIVEGKIQYLSAKTEAERLIMESSGGFRISNYGTEYFITDITGIRGCSAKNVDIETEQARLNSINRVFEWKKGDEKISSEVWKVLDEELAKSIKKVYELKNK